MTDHVGFGSFGCPHIDQGFDRQIPSKVAEMRNVN